MAISSAPRDYRTLIAAASLILGPLLMAIGDLLHPEERMAPAEQIAILVDHASRWYTAHLLLFVGMMLFIPGLLALAALTEARKPAVGYAARILVMVGPQPSPRSLWPRCWWAGSCWTARSRP